MPANSLIRSVSVLAVFILSACFPHTVFESVFVSVALSHYLLGFLYSGKQIADIFSRRQSVLSFAGLCLGGLLIINYQCPDIIFYFGLHHALNETYLPRSPNNPGAVSSGRLVTSRFCMNSFGYSVMLCHTPLFQFLPASFWILGFCLSLYFVADSLIRERACFSRPEFRDQVFFELIGLTVILSSLFIPISFRQIILYHFTVWMFLPLPKISRRKDSALWRYLFSMPAVTAAFCLLTPLGGHLLNIPSQVLDHQVQLWGYIHITSSLAFSSLNWQWVIRLFHAPV